MKMCDGGPIERPIPLMIFRSKNAKLIEENKPKQSTFITKKKDERLEIKTTPQFNERARKLKFKEEEEAQRIQKHTEAQKAQQKLQEEARMIAAAKAKEEEQTKIKQQNEALEAEAKKMAELKAKREQDELKVKHEKEVQAKIEAQKIASEKAALIQAAQNAAPQPQPVNFQPQQQQLGSAKDALCGQNKNLIEFWKKLLQSVQQKKGQANKLDQPLIFHCDDGPVNVFSVEETIVRIVNTFNKSDSPDPVRRDALMQDYANKLVDRLVELNQKFRHRPEVFEYAIFQTQESLVVNKSAAPIRNPDSSKIKEFVIEFIVNIYDRVAAALPQVGFKEIIIGYCCFRNRLFCPEFPDPNLTEIEKFDLVGFKIIDGKREAIEETTKRLKQFAVLFAAMHYSDSYIGRLYLMLECYLSMDYHQNIPQIVYHFLEVCGDKMKQIYGRKFITLLDRYKTQYIPACQQYIARKDMHKEPQNKIQYMKNDFDEMHDTGIHQANQFLERIKNRISELQ